MMMLMTSRIRWLVVGLMIAFGFASSVARAEVIIPGGTDYLRTLQPTFKDLGDPLGVVFFRGVPTFQFGSDTVVERLEDANATTGDPISTLLTGLSLVGNSRFGPVTAGLDPDHLADNVGTMSFQVTTPIIPNAVQTVGGTITDTLTVFWLATVPGIEPITGVEIFQSFGTWEGILSADQDGQGIVTDFTIIIDSHVDPLGQHTVTSTIPEPSSCSMIIVAAGVMMSGYAGWRRRRS